MMIYQKTLELKKLKVAEENADDERRLRQVAETSAESALKRVQQAETRAGSLEKENDALRRQVTQLQAAQTMANMRAHKAAQAAQAGTCPAEQAGFKKVDENTYVDAAHPGNRIVLPDGRRALNIRTWSEAYPGEPFDPRHPDVRITAKDAEILADFPDVNLDGVKIYEIDSSHRQSFYDNYAASTAYGDKMTWLGRHVPAKAKRNSKTNVPVNRGNDGM